MQVPHNSVVLVADGKKMVFFRNEGDAAFPKLEIERKQEQENPPNRAQKSDDPEPRRIGERLEDVGQRLHRDKDIKISLYEGQHASALISSREAARGSEFTVTDS